MNRAHRMGSRRGMGRVCVSMSRHCNGWRAFCGSGIAIRSEKHLDNGQQKWAGAALRGSARPRERPAPSQAHATAPVVRRRRAALPLGGPCARGRRSA